MLSEWSTPIVSLSSLIGPRELVALESIIGAPEWIISWLTKTAKIWLTSNTTTWLMAVIIALSLYTSSHSPKWKQKHIQIKKLKKNQNRITKHCNFSKLQTLRSLKSIWSKRNSSVDTADTKKKTLKTKRLKKKSVNWKNKEKKRASVLKKAVKIHKLQNLNKNPKKKRKKRILKQKKSTRKSKA